MFTYKDLKDGMICTLRNGEQLMVFKGRVYSFKSTDMSNSLEFLSQGVIGQWNADNMQLFDNVITESDIMKVEYDGEIVWKLQKCVSFIEAVNSEERFKHEDWEYYLPLDDVMLKLSQYSNSDIEKMIQSKGWIIEE